jgi:hypothetical protein
MRWLRDINVQPSACFEEDIIAVSFRAGSRKEFRAALDKLEDAARRQELDELFQEKR